MASPQLVDCVRCVVCMEQYDRTNHVPKLPPCGNTFCEGCIRDFTHKICPICRSYHGIPREGFVTNKLVLEIVDELLNERSLKCANHDKDAAIVCIDCLDALCVTCVLTSSPYHTQHYMEVPDVAKAILQKMVVSSVEEKLSLLKESPCSSSEMTKVDADIKSLEDNLCAQIKKWGNEERSKVQEIKSSAQEQERETEREKETKHQQNLDVTTLLLLCKIQRNKHGQDVKDDDFMNKLQLRETKADELGKLDDRLVALLHLEFESKTSFQSKLLRKERLISATQRSKRFTQGANYISEIPSFGRISDLSNIVLLLLANLIVMTLVFFASYSFIKITFGLSPIEHAVEEAEGLYGLHWFRSKDELFNAALHLYIVASFTSFVMQIICRRILTLNAHDKTFLCGLAYFCKFFFTMLGISSSPFWCLVVNADPLVRMLPIVLIPAFVIQWISPERIRRCIYRQKVEIFSNQDSATKKPLFGRICDSGNRWKLFCITIALSAAYIAIFNIFVVEHSAFVHDCKEAMGVSFVGTIFVFILQIVTRKVITMNVMGNSHKEGVKYTCQFFFMMLGIMSTVYLFHGCVFGSKYEAEFCQFVCGVHILASLVQLVPYQQTLIL